MRLATGRLPGLGTIEVDILMNALCAGEFWHGASARALAQGLREAGWNVHEIDVPSYFIRGRGGFHRALGRLLFKLSCRSFNRDILDKSAERDIGVLVAVKGSYISPDTVKTLRSRGIKSTIFYPDVNFEHPGLSLELIREVDMVYTTKSYHVPFLDGIRGPGRSLFVHHGYSPCVHRPRLPVDEADHHYDICYLGNPDSSKAALLKVVSDAFPNARMIVAGNGWEKFAAGSSLEKRITQCAVTGDFMAELIRRSRINIGAHGRPAGKRGWHDLVSTRTFEIPACKGFMLHEDNDEVRNLYEVGSEIDVFGTAEELVRKISSYLTTPEKRAEMAERAYRRAVPAYSYHARAREIVASWEALGLAA